MSDMKTATIVGAGLVGALWSVFLSQAGYKVRVFEKRPDLRQSDISAGKSINLALSDRGWKALRMVGLEEGIKKVAIPMFRRVLHDPKGNLTYQPYGKEGQAIYSVSRGGLNAKMLTFAEEAGDVKLSFNEECHGVDLNEGVVYLKNTLTGLKSEVRSDLVFGTDGAFSAVRYQAMQLMGRFNFSQQYIEDGYRELLLPANQDASYKLEKNALHIWPRGRFMLIALPNEDGSFTCTLFMPFEGYEYSFDKLSTKEEVEAFFQATFPDFYSLMPQVGEVWSEYPLSPLALIGCNPWTFGKTALLGDAAHATVPFYGQGMNCGFEDCSVMAELMQKHQENWAFIFKEYQEIRKPNADSMQKLSLQNYHVMRDHVANPEFLLQKKLERRYHELYPDKYIPLYSMVTFSHIPYAEALEKGLKQEARIKEIMNKYPVKQLFESGEIDSLIHQLMA